ncbi:glycerol-3-phosphate 1-O-acyltransferase PlsY [Ureaplasma canigenitalium]|uniref:glycerol-3-phosphate 1-O-acyltransferase PlsY n=1 Tax=Ureaplasma canigenitalium TaxID=42092 RepID=UPI00068FCFB2|nr:glycerol-3-phosphate 1-O-acyltransferase PlsY [Ureaplasma canigenitalium]
MVTEILYSYLLFFVFAPIYSYLIGALNFSIIVALIMKKEDIRNFHSKNAGATNMSRVHGMKLGIVVMFLDVIKAIIALSITYLVYKYALHEPIDLKSGIKLSPLTFFSAIFIILGHCFPIYFNFNGGKGVSCMTGILLVSCPIILLVSVLIMYIIVKFTRHISLGSMITSLIAVFLLLIPGFFYVPFYHEHLPDYFLDLNSSYKHIAIVFTFLIFTLIILVVQHRTNIKRLVDKNETNFFFSNKDKVKFEQKSVIN